MYLHFSPEFLVMLSLISKFMASPTGKQIITMYILLNISRGKSNQPIEYNAKNEKTS